MKTVNLVALGLGTLSFNLLFWNQHLGLNLVLFCIFSLLINYYNHPERFAVRHVQITTFAHLLTCFFLLFHGSTIALFSAFTSWIIRVGMYQEPELRTTYRAWFSAVINFFKLPPFFTEIRLDGLGAPHSKGVRTVRLLFFPLAGFLAFYLIFREANIVFKEITDTFLHDFNWLMLEILNSISGPRFVFFVFGLFVCSWFIFQAAYPYFPNKEIQKDENMKRVRRKNKVTEFLDGSARSGLGTHLKTENKTGILMIGMISVLLVFINLLDIVYVWFGYDFKTDHNYSADVHKGVNMLIFSIFLSIFIMLFFFRRNQNFYSKNNRLKKMAYFWIIQNVILLISVVIRNAHYINNQGLTHKRLGVFVFLVIVAIGLYSLFVKIAKTKSFFFMSKFNSWSVYCIMVFLACFNWDMIIFRSNIENRNNKEIDLYYLSQLSDEVYLELDMNNRLEENWDVYRLKSIKKFYKNKSGLSWTYRDTRIKACLSKLTLK